MPSAAIERCRCVLVGPPWPGRDALLRLFIVSYESSDAAPLFPLFPPTDDDLDELLPLAAADDVEWPR